MSINKIWKVVKKLPDWHEDVIDDIEKVFKNVDNLPHDVKRALQEIEEILGKLDRIIDNKLPDIYEKVKQLPDKANEIYYAITKEVLGSLTKLFNNLNQLIEFIGADGGAGAKFRELLEMFFKECGNILKNPVELLFKDGDFVKDIFAVIARLIGEASVAILTAVVNALIVVGDSLSNELFRIADKVAIIGQKLLGKLLEAFSKKLISFSEFPLALRSGPLNNCYTIKELYDWYTKSNIPDDILNRLSAVENSLNRLFVSISEPPHK